MSDSTHGPCFVAFSFQNRYSLWTGREFLWPGDTSHFCEPPPQSYSSSSELKGDTAPRHTGLVLSSWWTRGWTNPFPAAALPGPETASFSGKPATPCWRSSPNIPRTSQSGFLKEHHSCILIHTFLSAPKQTHIMWGLLLQISARGTKSKPSFQWAVIPQEANWELNQTTQQNLQAGSVSMIWIYVGFHFQSCQGKTISSEHSIQHLHKTQQQLLFTNQSNYN